MQASAEGRPYTNDRTAGPADLAAGGIRTSVKAQQELLQMKFVAARDNSAARVHATFMNFFWHRRMPENCASTRILARGSWLRTGAPCRISASFPRLKNPRLLSPKTRAGKALHYSRFTAEMVLADDSGLVVPALGGAPGRSFRAVRGTACNGCGSQWKNFCGKWGARRATNGARISFAPRRSPARMRNRHFFRFCARGNQPGAAGCGRIRV